MKMTLKWAWGLTLFPGFAFIGPPSALADRGQVESDNQFANPDFDFEQAQPVVLDSEGRMPMEVRGAFGKGLQFRAPDDSFAVEMRARAQLRALTHLDLSDDSQDFDALVRRLRLVLGGHVLRRRITYYIQLGFSRNDLEVDRPVPLRDAFMTWHAHRNLNLRFGQMKVPFDRQRVTSSSALQMVDRSLITQEMNLDRDVGIQIYSNDLFGWDWLAYNFGIFQGEGRNRVRGEFGLLTVARLQLNPLGQFVDFSEADFAFEARPKLAVAAAVGYNDNTVRAQSTIGELLGVEELDYLHATADLLFKWRGFSLLAQGMLRRLQARGSSTGEPLPLENSARSALGGFVQAGLLLSPALEITARLGHLEPQRSSSESALERLSEFGGGLSWYIFKHNLKFQLDNFVYLLGADKEVINETRLQSQIYF